MPISVTCECGARLEIDEKFLGKEIPCPDCQRPLPTTAPPKPPPLELPDNRRTSGLAVMSLAVGLVGMFAFIGPPIAIVLGVLAISAIRQSKKLDGLNFARAGIALGAAGIFLTTMILITPLGLDGIYREMAFLGKISYGSGAVMETRNGERSLKRPAAGRWATMGSQSQNLQVVDDLIAVNVSADAYMACQHITPGLFDDADNIQSKVLEQLRKSELVNMLGRLNGGAAPEPAIITQKKVDDIQETTLDMRVAGVERRFLVLYKTAKNTEQVYFFIGCARASRFERVEEQFRDAFNGGLAKK